MDSRSFYGGRRGASIILSKVYETVDELKEGFKNNEVGYDEYALVLSKDMTTDLDETYGNLYKRRFDGEAEQVGFIRGSRGLGLERIDVEGNKLLFYYEGKKEPFAIDGVYKGMNIYGYYENESEFPSLDEANGRAILVEGLDENNKKTAYVYVPDYKEGTFKNTGVSIKNLAWPSSDSFEDIQYAERAEDRITKMPHEVISTFDIGGTKYKVGTDAYNIKAIRGSQNCNLEEELILGSTQVKRVTKDGNKITTRIDYCDNTPAELEKDHYQLIQVSTPDGIDIKAITESNQKFNDQEYFTLIPDETCYYEEESNIANLTNDNRAEYQEEKVLYFDLDGITIEIDELRYGNELIATKVIKQKQLDNNTVEYSEMIKHVQIQP